MRPVAVGGRVVVVSLLLVGLWASGLGAQNTDSSGAKKGCARGRPAPACSSFLIFELGAQLPLTSSVRRFEGGGPGPPIRFEEAFHQWSFGWDLGVAFNVTETDALGVSLGVEVPETRFFLRGRYRRWLTEERSLELIPGVLRDRDSVLETGPSFGTTLGIRYNISDRGYWLLRYDVLFAEARQPLFPGAAADPGGTGHGLYVGAGLGSKPALWGTGALGVAFLIAYATFSAADGSR